MMIVAWVLLIIFVFGTMRSAKIFEYFKGNGNLIDCRIVLRSENSKIYRTIRIWGIWGGQYFIPLVVTGILYGFVVHKILTQKKVGGNVNKQRDAAKTRIVFMLITVVAVFFLCW